MDLWILSFSDCMVNLMAFFVMMLTFSSTGHSSKSRVEGVVPTKEGNSAMAMPGGKGGSLTPGAPALQETTETGSEFATDSDPVPTHNPKASPEAGVGAEAFRSRHDVAIPCRRLFYGQGAVLRPDAAECWARCPTRWRSPAGPRRETWSGPAW
ncbi:MAG: flagellar motor protein MotB [Planctomycetota bacterium]|nr:flagellar motor protein MotB [Planctomycetota bacterium]